MKTRMRLNSVSVGCFSSTFWPSSSAHLKAAGLGADPVRRQRADRVGIEGLVPRQRRDYARAGFSGEAAHRSLNQSRLAHGIGRHFELAVGDGSLQVIERPCGGFLFAQKTAGGIEKARMQLDRLPGL